MRRSSMREVRAGLLVLLALAGFLGMVGLAGGGPGFLAKRRTIDVVFRDGQGVRVGSPVRVAGIDAGRVTAVELAEVEGVLRAKVRLIVPDELAAKLRQDVKVTIQASLTGSTFVNIVSSGRSDVALVPGQLVQGVESSFFDPVLEQVGLGPVERSHLSHTIAEVRQTVDAAGPRLRQILGNLQEAVASLRETADLMRPSIETTAGRIESLSRKLDEAGLDQAVKRVDALVAQVEAVVTENRPAVQATLASARDLAGTLRVMAATDQPKVDALLDGLNTTRVRADHLLNQADVLATHGSELIARNKANLDRTMSNVKDATDYGVRLVQKLYSNPFYLSPFYKPAKDDVRAQEFYDAANTIMFGARELNDALAKLQAIRSTKPPPQMTAAEQKYYNDLFQRAWTLQGQLEQVNRQLAEGLRDTTRR